jgi:hypothetical protein
MAAEGLLPDLKFSKNMFYWQGMPIVGSDRGMIVVQPNPYNPERIMYLFLANSQLQMHKMTQSYRRGLPSWIMFKGDQVVGQGYDDVKRLTQFEAE